jgi:hypothetical protein
VLAPAMRLLRHDPNKHVRAMAAGSSAGGYTPMSRQRRRSPSPETMTRSPECARRRGGMRRVARSTAGRDRRGRAPLRDDRQRRSHLPASGQTRQNCLIESRMSLRGAS